jgi:hypothetical protein
VEDFCSERQKANDGTKELNICLENRPGDKVSNGPAWKEHQKILEFLSNQFPALQVFNNGNSKSF